MRFNGILTVSTLVSALLLPWPVTALLAIGASFLEPLVPLAAGLFADALYWAPHAGSLPVFTLYGALISAAAVFVRSRMRAGSIR